MSREEIQDILLRYRKGKADEADLAFLESWYNHFSERELEQLSAVERLAAVDLAWERILASLEEQEPERAGENGAVVEMDVDWRDGRRGFRSLGRWVAAAAVIVVLIGVGLYRYYSKQATSGVIIENSYVNDVAPGKQGATLTLADGKRILLSNAAKGELAKEAGVIISKTATGELIYKIQDNNKNTSLTNTLATSNGETYQVVLPDGTKVWLNAASSLRYPARFTAFNKRRVQLEGEAYFEVAKDEVRPFIVATKTQEVEVLGTHFNINSYSDEPVVRTTLLEGAVKVTADPGVINGAGAGSSHSITLKPGFQASLNSHGGITTSEANVNLAVAWKDGKFRFDNERIEDIMRMLARWYNVEVIYEKGAGDQPFTGSISRSENISRILDKITFTQNIHFKIEGRRVTVMP